MLKTVFDPGSIHSKVIKIQFFCTMSLMINVINATMTLIKLNASYNHHFL